MKTRDIIIGLVVLVVLISAALLIRRAIVSKNQNLPIPTPNISENVENKFPGLTIPANADKASLTNVGANQGEGEAFRTYENGVFNLTLMSDLPTPVSGNYQGYISNGTNQILLGTLATGKGGYLVNFSSRQDLTGYNTIFVTLGSDKILSGSF